MQTEAQNPNTTNLDKQSSSELVETFIQEDQKVLEAISQAKDDIAKAIDLVHKSLKDGGRLFYFGAGTSGRLGVLDASECPPTFSADPEMVQGIIAGGDEALRKAIEGAEDSEENGYEFVIKNLKKQDIAIGISASGTTPFVIGVLKAAKTLGIANISISNNENSPMSQIASHSIFLNTGEEILAGSTRLKAGTSQKMVLNIISTSAMVKLGKVYQNLMVDLQAKNAKLVKRAQKLVQKITNCNEARASEALEASDYKVKNAVLYIAKGMSFEESEEALKSKDDFLGECL